MAVALRPSGATVGVTVRRAVRAVRVAQRAAAGLRARSWSGLGLWENRRLDRHVHPSFRWWPPVIAASCLRAELLAGHRRVALAAVPLQPFATFRTPLGRKISTLVRESLVAHGPHVGVAAAGAAPRLVLKCRH